MCEAIEVQERLKTLHSGSLERLRESIGCKASIGTLGRIINGQRVGERTLREVARAAGLYVPESPSTKRRRKLRLDCKEKLGVTVEDAATLYLEMMTK